MSSRSTTKMDRPQTPIVRPSPTGTLMTPQIGVRVSRESREMDCAAMMVRMGEVG